MSLDILITGLTSIRGDIFDTWYSCVSWLFSDSFNYDSSSCHISSSIPPLHWSSIKWITLRYVVMAGNMFETYTKKPRTCCNFLWLKSSPFCASSLIHYKCLHVFPHFKSSIQVNNSLCWYVTIVPSNGPEVLLGLLHLSCGILKSQLCAVCGNPPPRCPPLFFWWRNASNVFNLCTEVCIQVSLLSDIWHSW